LRHNRNQEGDDENKRVSKKDRKAKAFVSEAEKEYSPPTGTHQKDEVDDWLTRLRPDAEFNMAAYVDCFYSENLIRRFIENQSEPIGPKFIEKIAGYEGKEQKKLDAAYISYPIARSKSGLGYLGMHELSEVAEGGKAPPGGGAKNPLCHFETKYTPVRDAVGHTRLLTRPAKSELNLTLENIKGRLRKLLENVKPSA
jgi:hypothetical protein